MALTQFQLVYSAREDRALLRIELDDGDAYRLWLTRAMTRELLVRASCLRTCAPNTVAALDRAMRQTVQPLEMLGDPSMVRTTACPLGEAPVLLDSLALSFAPAGVFCTLGARGHFRLHLELSWSFFKHWLLMLENVDEDASWQLMPSFAIGLGYDAPGEVLAFAAARRAQRPRPQQRAQRSGETP